MNALAQFKEAQAEAESNLLTPYWGAQLQLKVLSGAIASSDRATFNRSYLADVRHEGPLRVQRPFYPEGPDCCHIYMLHPPGGLVSGDHLQIDVEVGDDAKALLTTPAAGKVYRANLQGTAQTQQVHIQVGKNACLEWLPQENILFDQACAHLQTEIHLNSNSRMVAWELVCLGRTESVERFASGNLRQRFSIWSDGIPLYLDHWALRGEDAAMDAAWGLQGARCVGTLVCACGDMERSERQQLLDLLREQIGDSDQVKLGISQLRNLLVVRLLAVASEPAKTAMTRAWQLVRPALMQREACMPRIWNT